MAQSSRASNRASAVAELRGAMAYGRQYANTAPSRTRAVPSVLGNTPVIARSGRGGALGYYGTLGHPARAGPGRSRVEVSILARVQAFI